MLTKRERQLLEEIRVWEEKLYFPDNKNNTYNDWLEYAFKKLPKRQQKKFYQLLDQLLFHLHAIIQSSQFQNDARNRILQSAKADNPFIQDILDMRSLPIESLIFYAEQEIAKHRLYSFTQGGLTGSGGLLFITADLPLLVAINLRIVQNLSLIYGYEVNTPYEMMTSFKVFHVATLPRHMQANEWKRLIRADKLNKNQYFWNDGHEIITDQTWLNLPIKQILKGLFLSFAKKKLIQGIPLIGMGIGAGINYTLTKQVAEFAHHFYQLRYLTEKDDIHERN